MTTKPEPQKAQEPCPLCSNKDAKSWHIGRHREYCRCPHCMLVFVPTRYHLSLSDEKAEYDLHENSPYDEGYRRFLSRITTPLTERLTPGMKGLDFGCGPGPVLSMMLKDKGYSTALYDPFYFPDSGVLEDRYDFITATEVAEHLNHPGIEFERLFRMLKSGGFLGLMTKLVLDKDAFSRWHYIHDQTHICFYSRESFQYIAEKYNAGLEFIGNDVIIMKSAL